MADLPWFKGKRKFERIEKDADRYKILDRVFDQSTLLTVYDLIKKGVIEKFQGIVSAGKEADIFSALSPEGSYLAVKIYRIATTDFKRKFEYISTDPRFHKVRRSRKAVVYAWVSREFKNLVRAQEAGVSAPQPISFANNVLVMEFIGEGGIPYPRMVDSAPPEPDTAFRQIIENVKKLYRVGRLVHADLSEYNILVTPDPVLIDFSMATDISNPVARDLLVRDLSKILNYFRKFEVDLPSLEDLFREVTQD